MVEVAWGEPQVSVGGLLSLGNCIKVLIESFEEFDCKGNKVAMQKERVS